MCGVTSLPLLHGCCGGGGPSPSAAGGTARESPFRGAFPYNRRRVLTREFLFVPIAQANKPRRLGRDVSVWSRDTSSDFCHLGKCFSGMLSTVVMLHHRGSPRLSAQSRTPTPPFPACVVLGDSRIPSMLIHSRSVAEHLLGQAKQTLLLSVVQERMHYLERCCEGPK